MRWSAPRAFVVREGLETEIHAAEIVQGDLIHLKQGDQVVADGPVVSRAAEVDEALLTGESDTIKKEAGEELPVRQLLRCRGLLLHRRKGRRRSVRDEADGRRPEDRAAA